MHGSSERGDAGSEGDARAGRPPARPLASIEAYALCLILLVAIGVSNLALYFKLDAFQHASISLVESLDEARIKQSAIDAQKERIALTEILAQVKANELKTNGVADQILEIAQQTSQVGHQNAVMLEQLKTITSAHTKDIIETKHQATAAKSAAQKAQIQTKQTQKAITEPWYKRVFH